MDFTILVIVQGANALSLRLIILVDVYVEDFIYSLVLHIDTMSYLHVIVTDPVFI